MNIIYPTLAKKYSGYIKEFKGVTGVTYRLRIRNGLTIYEKSFKTYEEAFAMMKKINIEEGLLIKNIIHDNGDHMTCSVTGKNNLIFDPEKIELVQGHCWYSGPDDYPATLLNNRIQFFHNLVLEFTPTKDRTIDHINRNIHDNRIVNLRIANWRTQRINQGIGEKNSSGVKGVSFCARNNMWRVHWSDVDGKSKGKSFAVKKYGGGNEAFNLAVAYRRNIEETLPHYSEALRK